MRTTSSASGSWSPSGLEGERGDDLIDVFVVGIWIERAGANSVGGHVRIPRQIQLVLGFQSTSANEGRSSVHDGGYGGVSQQRLRSGLGNFRMPRRQRHPSGFGADARIFVFTQRLKPLPRVFGVAFAFGQFCSGAGEVRIVWVIHQGLSRVDRASSKRPWCSWAVPNLALGKGWLGMQCSQARRRFRR